MIELLSGAGPGLFPALLRWVHILAAAFWVGGTLFVVLVVTPIVRMALDTGERVRLVSAVGRRFDLLGWWAIGILVITGGLNTLVRFGWDAGAAWDSLTASPWGVVLLAKLALLAVVLVLTWIHSYRLAPRMEALAEEGRAESDEMDRARGRLIALSSVQLLGNLAIVFLAALMAVV